MYLSEGELCVYQGRQDFGDGDGDLLAHIEKSHKYYLDTEEGRDFLNYMSKEEADRICENSRYVLEEFLPVMRYFCNLDKIEKAIFEERQAAGEVPLGIDQKEARETYQRDLLAYIQESRIALNMGQELPKMPDIREYVQDTERDSYREHVLEEIAAEAEAYGMTVEEYAKNGYEPLEKRR